MDAVAKRFIHQVPILQSIIYASLISLIYCLEEPPKLFISNDPSLYSWYENSQINESIVGLPPNSEYAFHQDTKSAAIICNATYPITWHFPHSEQVGHASWLLMVELRRSAKILYDSSTYVYTAQIGIYGEYNRVSGNYSCRSTTKSWLQNSVYVFWEGSAPPFLLQAGENRSVCEDTIVKLPCTVSRPNLRANLYKELNGVSVPLKLNNSIYYSPKDGFRLTNLPNVLGTYRCTVTADQQQLPSIIEFPTLENHIEDVVRIKVEKCNSTATINLKSNASFTYNPAKRELVCCSNSLRSPKMFHFYCHHPIMCAFRQDIDSSFLRAWFSQKRSQRGCSKYKIYIHSPGVVRCVGDGIDSTIEYSFPLIMDFGELKNTSGIPIYFNWNEIQSTEMIIIKPMNFYFMSYGNNRDEPLTIYESQDVTFYCHTSSYYFARGVHWAIKYKNNTFSYVDQYPEMYYGYSHHASSRIDFYATLDMESVLCIAPVWNSSDYVHKIYHLYVNKSVSPVIIGQLEETLIWTLNDTDKELSCQAKGIPTPYLDWHRNESSSMPSFTSLYNTSYHDNVSDTYVISETLRIPRVAYATQGVYVCVAWNYGGRVEKTIRINVEEPPSWKTRLAIIIGVVLALILVTGVLLLIWRMRVETRTVEQLAAITYQDAISNSEAVRRAFASLTTTAMTNNHQNERTTGTSGVGNGASRYHHNEDEDDEQRQQEQNQLRHFTNSNHAITNSLID